MNRYLKRIVTGILAGALCLSLLPNMKAYAVTNDTKATEAKGGITPTGLTLDEVEAKVDTYMKQYIEKSVPGAAVSIIKDNQIVFQKGYGYSDTTSKKAVDPEHTMFRFSNLSQIYTWTAVLQLVEQGKLDLEADILDYLPKDFANKLKERLISDNPITLTHLINHTAGFEEIGNDTAFLDSSKLQENLEQALLVTMPNQIYAPGQVMTADSYSAALAAFIVEQVTGTTYQDYIKTNILDKIGATSTILLKKESDFDKLGDFKSVEYLQDTMGNLVSQEVSYSNLYPTNSIWGTASDLAKLTSQLMLGKEDGTILSKASLDTMYAKSYAIQEGAKASLHGLYEYPADIKAYYCDGGNASTTMMVMHPETGFGMVITTNTSAALELLYGLSYELLVGDVKTSVTAKDDLPGVANVTDKEYVGSKRPYSGALEFIGYFSNYSKFTRVDKHTISLNEDKYVQVAPYVYKYVGDNESPLYKTIASTVYFKADSTGKAFKWSYSASSSAEYVYSENNKTQSTLVITIFLLVVSVGFILLSAIVAIVGLIKDAIKRRFTWQGVRFANTIFTVLLSLTIINNWAALSDISSAQGIMASSLNLHIVFNIILSIIEMFSLLYLVYCMRNERQKRMKNLMLLLTMVMYIGSIYFLQTWNFYSIM